MAESKNMLMLRPLVANTAYDNKGAGSGAGVTGNTVKDCWSPKNWDAAEPVTDKFSVYCPSGALDIMKEETKLDKSKLESNVTDGGFMIALETGNPDKYSTGVTIREVPVAGAAVK